MRMPGCTFECDLAGFSVRNGLRKNLSKTRELNAATRCWLQPVTTEFQGASSGEAVWPRFNSSVVSRKARRSHQNRRDRQRGRRLRPAESVIQYLEIQRVLTPMKIERMQRDGSVCLVNSRGTCVATICLIDVRAGSAQIGIDTGLEIQSLEDADESEEEADHRVIFDAAETLSAERCRRPFACV